MNLVKPQVPVNPAIDLRGVDTSQWSIARRIDLYPYCQLEPGLYYQHVMIDLFTNEAMALGWDEEDESCHCLEAAAAHLRDILNDGDSMVA